MAERIGGLYGFDLYIRQNTEPYNNNGEIQFRPANNFYSESPGSGLKYTYNQGHPNVDNPKLAARHFLNAIDRVETTKEKYQKEVKELEHNIPILEKIIAKPFEKEQELQELKKDLSRLEREIAVTIQAKQMITKEAPVIQMEEKQDKKTLLPKLHEGRSKGMRI